MPLLRALMLVAFWSIARLVKDFEEVHLVWFDEVVTASDVEHWLC